MIMNRLAIRATAVAGFFFLSAAPGLMCAQVTQPVVVQPSRIVSPAARPMRDTRITDEFAGLKFTDEQKAKIDEIHRRTATRKDVVVKSEKFSRRRGPSKRWRRRRTSPGHGEKHGAVAAGGRMFSRDAGGGGQRRVATVACQRRATASRRAALSARSAAVG